MLIHVADRATVFTGDILFVEGHPILWAGTIPDLLGALDRIEAWQPETIVLGHGPITDLAGVREIRAYYEHATPRRDAVSTPRWILRPQRPMFRSTGGPIGASRSAS